MKHIYTAVLCLVIVSLLGGFLSTEAEAAEICEEWIAKAVSVQGEVQVRRTGETKWETVEFSNTFCIGDIVRVQERSRAVIVLANDTILRLDQDTSIIFNGIEKKQALVEMLKGVVHFFSRFPRSLKIVTPFVNGTVEGTEFAVKTDEKKTVITIFKGKLNAMNKAGILALTSGQSLIAEAGKAPALHTVVRPRDAVQWALYYPLIISFRPGDFPGEGWKAEVRNSIEHYLKGDLLKAFHHIDEVDKDIMDPRFLNYRATLLLSVGRVNEAGGDIEKALTLEPGNGYALALQSIIAVVQNEKDRALDLAHKAVKAAPDSAAALIALSYAQQADFELEDALDSIKKAVELEPDNSLAWARLAELRLSFGEIDKSLEAAKKAVQINPDTARAQSVLGFAYLSQIRLKESMKAFEKAIELDQVAPLPRLGLGLAKIRKGDLIEGRKEIEIAVSLDPDNSVIRSYLGKALYEEKRDKKATEELATAKELDRAE
jgi:tetratricopeptide (TPR) repeat protein